MNTFIKSVISIIFLGITYSVFPQQPIHVSQQKVNIPFYNGDAVRSSFLKQQTTSDTIWLPASVRHLWNDTPSSHYIYEYHKNGLLKKFTSYSEDTGEIEGMYDYNNTYRDPLEDVLDTVLIGGYTDFYTGEYHPPYRYYYNNRQADSLYWEEYYQARDGDKWKPGQKTIYVHYLPDTATVLEWQNHVEWFNENGSISDGWKAFLTFDEQGTVIEALIEVYNVLAKQYKVAAKNIYLYDDEGKCHTKEQHVPASSGTWKLNSKFTNMKWFEFHGFDNGDMLFFGHPVGLHDHYSPKNKNKVSNFDYWSWAPGPFALEWIDTITWETEPFSYRYDHFWNTGCIAQRWYQNFNEHYHITAKGEYTCVYSVAPCPDFKPDRYLLDDYINKYDDRQRRYEYIENHVVHLPTWPPDSILHTTMTYIVDSFTYVGNVSNYELQLDKHLLLIVPNPADETVRITAADSIVAITLYASDGRLAYGQDGSGKEMIVNLKGLSKGVYIVQVRLKDGGVQTGKIIVK